MKPTPGKESRYLVANSNEWKPAALTNVLHRNFATLDSEAKVLKFANKYGFLGQGFLLYPAGGGKTNIGEPLTLWHDKVRELGRLLYLWDLMKDRDRVDVAKLGEIIIWRGDKVYFDMELSKCLRQGEVCRALIASKKVNTEVFERWQLGNKLVEPALYYLYGEINKHLRRAFSFRLSLPRQLHTIAPTLESSMWLLFAREITEITNFEKCGNPDCDQWVDPRWDKRYCSAACKQKVYYRKHPKRMSK